MVRKKYHLEIDREPYYYTFQYKNKKFTIVNFPAITKNKQPETEIKYFKCLLEQYSALNLVFVCDFNCPQSHTVFNPLKKMRYQFAFITQKTSLKRKYKNGKCLASEFDNIFYQSAKIKAMSSGVLHFYKNLNSLKEARTI